MSKRFPIQLAGLCKTVLFCLLLVPFCAASGHGDDWSYEETHTDSRDFVSGGMVHVRLKIGDLQIHRGDTNQIRLRYTIKSRHEKSVKDAHVDFDVHGKDANLEFHIPHGNTAVDVELEVPANTNLDVHEKVGDLTVGHIEGNKDLDLGIGDIRVEAIEAKFSLVRDSAGIGDVNSEYGEGQGWLGKTIRYSGDGKYELRAHVSIGDITVEGK